MILLIGLFDDPRKSRLCDVPAGLNRDDAVQEGIVCDYLLVAAAFLSARWLDHKRGVLSVTHAPSDVDGLHEVQKNKGRPDAAGF